VTEVADLDAKGPNAKPRGVETDATTQPGSGMARVPLKEVMAPLISVGAPQLEATGLQLQRCVLFVDQQ
jgi:hypothetical protein